MNLAVHDAFENTADPRGTGSRLLALPAEIRTVIFEFALCSKKPVVAFRLDQYQRESYEEAIPPSLTRVSRQVRQESLLIFYEINEIIFHTDESKDKDTRSWLRRNEARLPKLLRLSFWLRYVTLTNDPGSSNGAVCISVRRRKGETAWRVDDSWRWVTVTRRPGAVEGDARFLIETLNSMLSKEPDCFDKAETFMNTIIDLRMLYVKEKMS